LPKTILDLGAYNGVASTDLVGEKDRWILVDNRQYEQYDGWRTPGLPPKAEYYEMDLMDWKEPAEIVVCSNVLYHVPDPHAMLKHLRELTLERLYLTTYVADLPSGWVDHTGGKHPHLHRPTAFTLFMFPSTNALVDELKELGFNILKVEPIWDMVKVICAV